MKKANADNSSQGLLSQSDTHNGTKNSQGFPCDLSEENAEELQAQQLDKIEQALKYFLT